MANSIVINLHKQESAVIDSARQDVSATTNLQENTSYIRLFVIQFQLRGN